LLKLARWTLNVIFGCIAILVILDVMGVNANAALAGLGIGGIAVALAAQKTLENVIGGVSIVFDRVVNVGDFVRFGTTAGIIDEIGLRSTRIRTPDRTLVNVPNGQLALASLENLSARDSFWFHPVLRLAYDTSQVQIRTILDAIVSSLKCKPYTRIDSVRARLISYGAESLDIEVSAYFMARDPVHFLELQEECLLETMNIVEHADVCLAVPGQLFRLPPLPPQLSQSRP
jgi:MscS family membrane protein